MKKQFCNGFGVCKTYTIIFIFSLFLGIFTTVFAGEKVIIVVIDGSRYSETFGAGDTYIPNIWNIMKPAGTIYTNFYNFGSTSTNPGHASIASGTWQFIANDGSERPTQPTIFEYFRKQLGTLQSKNSVVAGKNKLDLLTYSTHVDYGSSFQASNNAIDMDDWTNYNNLVSIMDNDQPDLIIVNFSDVDGAGHNNDWSGYLTSIQDVDYLIYQLWQKIQTDNYYKDKTTLFVTNDHGRHDDLNGGFKEHGDSCDGCQHLMLLVIGNNVTAGQVISEIRDQRDIAPTVGDILGFDTPHATGTSLYEGDTSLPVALSSFSATVDISGEINIQWITESELNNLGFNILRSTEVDKGYLILNSNLIEGNGNTSSETQYSYIDREAIIGINYFYKLQDFSLDGSTKMHGPIPYTWENNNSINEKNNLTVYQNIPNPFNTSTNIRFSITEPSNIKVTIYDNLGRKIKILFNGSMQAGFNSLPWETANFASGLYFYSIESKQKLVKGKMVLLK